MKEIFNAINMAKKWASHWAGDSGGLRLQEGIDGLQAYALALNHKFGFWDYPQIHIVALAGRTGTPPGYAGLCFPKQETGFMGIAGPAFVKTQLGEEISIENLCGVDSHAKWLTLSLRAIRMPG